MTCWTTCMIHALHMPKHGQICSKAQTHTCIHTAGLTITVREKRISLNSYHEHCTDRYTLLYLPLGLGMNLSNGSNLNGSI